MTKENEKPNTKGDNEMEAILPKKQVESPIDLSQAWKNSPRLNANNGAIILDRNNPQHREFFRDEDEN